MASFNNTGRLYGMLTMSISWFQDEKVCDGIEFSKCYRPYNRDLLDATAEPARIIVQVLTVLMVIICILCFKYRSLAGAFIYIEFIIQTAALFYPNSNRSWATDYFIGTEYLLYTTHYYCGSVCSFYYVMAALTFATFFNRHVAYLEPIDGVTIAIKIGSLVGIFFVGAYMVTYIDRIALLHKQL